MKSAMADCEDCLKSDAARIDHFDRTLRLTEAQRAELIAIADRCPVHRTLAAGVRLITRAEPPPQ